MNLAKMLFHNLEDQDFFGFKILKNGFNPEIAQQNPVGIGSEKLTQPVCQYLQDVIVLEEKRYNTHVKT